MNDNTWKLLNGKSARLSDASRNTLDTPSDVEIVLAQAELGCKFCDDYVAFLKKYGSAYAGSFPIFGLRPIKMMGDCWSVVKMTKWSRSDQLSEVDDRWPEIEQWYVISNDGYGNWIGIMPEGHVLIADHDHGCIDEMAPNFEQFLLKWCLVEHDDSDLFGDPP